MTTPRTKEYPRSACLMPLGASHVALLAADEGKKGPRKFSMVINTGKVMSHWFWGQLAIDLEGVQPATKPVPTLLQHDATKRVGWTEAGKYEVTERGLEPPGGTGSFLMRGSEHATEVMEQGDAGFPWQASPWIEALSIEEVATGASVEVNGRKLTGPGVIFRQSRILENSFVAVGADDDTQASALSGDGDPMLSAEIVSPAKRTMKAKTKTRAAALSAQDQDDDIPTGDTESQETTAPAEQPATETPSAPATETPPPASTQSAHNPPSTGAPVGPEGVLLERTRVTSILAAAHPSQAALAQQLVVAGATLTEALQALQADSVQRLALSAATPSDAPLGAGNVVTAAAASAKPAKGSEAELRARWDSADEGPQLKADFDGDFASFQRFEAGVAAGRIRILKRA